jgi:putative SOS response-associated peptidase YedK
MCGRYTLIKLSDFTDMFPWIRSPEPEAPPRYNIAPTQEIAVVPNDGNDRVEMYRWGLIPWWAKDVSIGNRMINARAEGLAEKPAFRDAFRRRRCLIPASGFYEWKKSADGKRRQPMYIRMKGGKPFAFAGLWDVWRDENGQKVRSCTIITGQPNELVNPIHDRMPVILRPEHYRKWLEPLDRSPDELMPLLETFSAEAMEAYPVSKLVNSPANESAQCIDPQTGASLEPAAADAEKSKKKKGKKPETGGLFD